MMNINLAEFKLTNLLIILYVQIRMNVLTTRVFRLSCFAETDLLVPAMAVPNITIAAMTSLDILPIWPTKNIEKNLLMLESVSI